MKIAHGKMRSNDDNLKIENLVLPMIGLVWPKKSISMCHDDLLTWDEIGRLRSKNNKNLDGPSSWARSTDKASLHGCVVWSDRWRWTDNINNMCELKQVNSSITNISIFQFNVFSVDYASKFNEDSFYMKFLLPALVTNRDLNVM